VQKSLEEKFLRKEKITILELEMIFIVSKCRREKIPNLKSELCYASQKNIACPNISSQQCSQAPAEDN
jgi:hypothetical protein